MSPITNLAGYRFIPVEEPEKWKSQLLPLCRELGLKGTILLAPEGINFFLAGTRSQLDPVLTLIRSIPGMADLTPKESSSATQPFQRMLVKVKKEIVPFGIEGVDPARQPTPKITARDLKTWLDEKRPVTLLDVRNDYEVRLGTFERALNPKIDNFRDFPAAVKKLDPTLKNQAVVMFCTGGIRCEKAGPFMQKEGFEKILQLDGGILKYFEEVGGAHFSGECFVFDERVGVDSQLRETDSVLCYNCQMPLLASDLNHPHYVYEKSCHYCFHGKPKGRGNTAEHLG